MVQVTDAELDPEQKEQCLMVSSAALYCMLKNHMSCHTSKSEALHYQITPCKMHVPVRVTNPDCDSRREEQQGLHTLIKGFSDFVDLLYDCSLN